MTTETMLPELDVALNMKVQQFYNYEAEVLDDRRFRDWLALFDCTATYRMPIRRVMPPRERRVEFSGEHEMSVFDETYADLEQRIEKLETGKAWAEEPPSRTRHCVTNVRVRRQVDGLAARSSFVIYQGRWERDNHVFYGEKRDFLVERGGVFGLSIAKRLILLDHTTLEVPAVSIFF